MSEEKKFVALNGYKDITFKKHFVNDAEEDSTLTMIIKEGGFLPIHIDLSPDDVANIIKGFNWSKKINKGDK